MVGGEEGLGLGCVWSEVGEEGWGLIVEDSGKGWVENEGSIGTGRVLCELFGGIWKVG